MKPQPIIHCVTILDCSNVPGCAVEFFYALELDFSTWKDEESGQVRYTIYCRDEGHAKQVATRIKEILPIWQEYGVVLDEIRLDQIKKEDWAESWKIHFKPIEVSPHIVVKPSWESYPELPGKHVIVLDPGMSFGTGQHATTKSCIAAIDRFVSESREKNLSFLDAGCGSGILFIAAKLLGCYDVRAFDIDPDVIPIACENAKVNHIDSTQFQIQVAALLDYPNDTKFDIVAANILSSALLEGKEHLVSLVKPDGILILAGILATEYDNIRNAFQAMGCKELSNSAEREWKGGVFRTPKA